MCGGEMNIHGQKSYLVQQAILDVSNWEMDQDFGVFPAGARAKYALLAPDACEFEFLVPGRRYLLKRSQKRYPDQFWGEIIAYRVGQLLGFDTPATFVAYDRRSGVVGALVQWFYDDQSERFVPAGDFLHIIKPSFDRKLGKAHNLLDNMAVARILSMSKQGGLKGVDWRNWWADALAFDALIGNTDRHQENWGFILSPSLGKMRFAPLFDNGTSLGQDRFPHLVCNWSEVQLDQYLHKGRSHATWNPGDERECLFVVLRKFLTLHGPNIDVAGLQSRLSIPAERLGGCLTDLVDLVPPPPFRHLALDRIEWIERNLLRRFEILKELLNEFNQPSV